MNSTNRAWKQNHSSFHKSLTKHVWQVGRPAKVAKKSVKLFIDFLPRWNGHSTETMASYASVQTGAYQFVTVVNALHGIHDLARQTLTGKDGVMLSSTSQTGSNTSWVRSTRRDLRRTDLPMTEEWLLDQLKILVVEDHEDTAQSMAELLNLAGGVARIARSAEEALRMAREESPDVVLLEPLIRDGWLVPQRIRKIAAPKLIIVLSCRGNEDDGNCSHAAEVDLHLVKPVAPATLLHELRRVMPNH